MSLISLCHMNRPMAFSLRSHVTLIRFRNINKAVKIKSQHQSPIRWKCHNYSQNALHHCRRGFRDQSKINESTIHHISIWSQRCVTISYLQSNLVSYQRMNENLMANTTYCQGVGCDGFLRRTHAPRTSRSRFARTVSS